MMVFGRRAGRSVFAATRRESETHMPPAPHSAASSHRRQVSPLTGTRARQACRLLLCGCALALLAACAGGEHPQLADQRGEAAHYVARASGNYQPPGPPEDPWRPYISEAAQRFDVPERWIREVMRTESGGREYVNGQLVTSPKGAMGLMQVMPATFDLMRQRHGLGDDPYDPRNNILAGTAYIREMYDIYGAPAFLAAYNAGPARLDDQLQHHRPLPDETRRYVAMIAPHIQDSWPANRAAADRMAWNQAPLESRRPAATGGSALGSAAPPPRSVQVAALRPPPVPPAAPVSPALPVPPTPPVQLAAVTPGHRDGGFRLISTAVAAEAPLAHGGDPRGAWAIQVGAFAQEGQAFAAALAARDQARGLLAVSHPVVGGILSPHGKLYRARLTGLSRDAAAQACDKLARQGLHCLLVAPNAQS